MQELAPLTSMLLNGQLLLPRVGFLGKRYNMDQTLSFNQERESLCDLGHKHPWFERKGRFREAQALTTSTAPLLLMTLDSPSVTLVSCQGPRTDGATADSWWSVPDHWAAQRIWTWRR